MGQSKDPDAYAREWHDLLDFLTDAKPNELIISEPTFTYKTPYALQSTWFGFVRAITIEADRLRKVKDFDRARLYDAKKRVLKSYQSSVNGKKWVLTDKSQVPKAQALRNAIMEGMEQYKDQIELSRRARVDEEILSTGGTTKSMQEIGREKDLSLAKLLNIPPEIDRLTNLPKLYPSTEEGEEK